MDQVKLMVLMIIPACLATSSDASNPQLELISNALRNGLKNVPESIVMNYGLDTRISLLLKLIQTACEKMQVGYPQNMAIFWVVFILASFVPRLVISQLMGVFDSKKKWTSESEIKQRFLIDQIQPISAALITNQINQIQADIKFIQK